MTNTEVTVAMMQLKAQQQTDHAWFNQATQALDDHAMRLDRIAVSVMKLRAETAEAVAGTQQVVATIANHHDEHTQAILMLGDEARRQQGQLDAELRGHVVEEAKTVRANMDILVARLCLLYTSDAADE